MGQARIRDFLLTPRGTSPLDKMSQPVLKGETLLISDLESVFNKCINYKLLGRVHTFSTPCLTRIRKLIVFKLDLIIIHIHTQAMPCGRCLCTLIILCKNDQNNPCFVLVLLI